MLAISYNISPKLKENLYRIENFRKKILLSSISPKTELKLKWHATFNKIFSCIRLSGSKLQENDVIRILSRSKSKKMSQEEIEVLTYKNSLDQINQNWLGSDAPVTPKSILSIYRKISNGQLNKEKELDYLLNYLQARKENPIIQGAIAYIELMKMQPFTKNNSVISLLVSLLFLYKNGYDFKGFLAYEPLFMEKQISSLTLWLENISENLLRQIDLIDQYISKPNIILQNVAKSFWELNERQQSVLNFLENPNVTITNRNIQKWHKVSQITASRDLAKLTSLGFLFSHGKGRSVYYTKI